MSDGDVNEPLIHIKGPGGSPWGVCFSRLGKIVVTVATGLVSSILIGAFIFAWQSNEVLGRILERLDGIDSRISAVETAVTEKSNRNESRIERLEGKHGL